MRSILAGLNSRQSGLESEESRRHRHHERRHTRRRRREHNEVHHPPRSQETRNANSSDGLLVTDNPWVPALQRSNTHGPRTRETRNANLSNALPGPNNNHLTSALQRSNTHAGAVSTTHDRHDRDPSPDTLRHRQETQDLLEGTAPYDHRRNASDYSFHYPESHLRDLRYWELHPRKHRQRVARDRERSYAMLEGRDRPVDSMDRGRGSQQGDGARSSADMGSDLFEQRFLEWLPGHQRRRQRNPCNAGRCEHRHFARSLDE